MNNYHATDVKDIKVDTSENYTVIRIIHTHGQDDSISFKNADADKLERQLFAKLHIHEVK